MPTNYIEEVTMRKLSSFTAAACLALAAGVAGSNVAQAAAQKVDFSG